MLHWMADPPLEGAWSVERTGGFLPPLIGVRKEISARRGVTRLGSLLEVRFDVVGLELRYRFPFAGVVDVLTPSGDGFSGRTLVFGREIGKFRMISASEC
jgi:hypothetical protein